MCKEKMVVFVSFRIGNVQINDDHYLGEDLYSDGDIENEYIAIAKGGNFENTLKHDNRWPILYHFSDIRENLLEWYPFSKKGCTLEIGAGCGAMTGLLCRKTKHVTAIELSMKRSKVNAYRNKDCDNLKIMVGNFEDIEPSLRKFDYITLIGVWEYSASYISSSEPYLKMLSIALKHLKPNGKVFIAIENKMGIKYWNGAVEDHTGKEFSGLRNYVDTDKVRTFSKPEIETMFRKLSITQYSFYYPMPDYKLPNVIYSDNCLPKPGDERNYNKDYSCKHQYIFNDALITDQICADKIFPYFSNSFLIVAGGCKPNIVFAKYNRLRRPEYRTKIEILYKSNGLIVKKSPLTSLAKKHIVNFVNNELAFAKSGLNIKVSQGCLEDSCYTSNYIVGERFDDMFYDNRMSLREWLTFMVHWKSKIYGVNSSASRDFFITDDFIKWFGNVKLQDKVISLTVTNIDMNFSNIILHDNESTCIDNEWIFKFPIPLDFVWWRAAHYFYDKFVAYINKKMSIEDFLYTLGVSTKNIDTYHSMEHSFLDNIAGVNLSENYLLRYNI